MLIVARLLCSGNLLFFNLVLQLYHARLITSIVYQIPQIQELSY